MRVNVIEPKVARSLTQCSRPNPLFLRDEELTRGIELLDAAYRALLAEPDRALREPRASAATTAGCSIWSVAIPGSPWSSCWAGRS